ncbi:MAG TPA: CocE/NonD family hydrolase [Thermoleophilaceae bacterium]|nr:CocE/NonD family hydrolase [Thermoleophilaceae bacterium]
MQVDWDVPIEMDDGVVLRADVFRPDDDGRHAVILSYGPYAKGLAFQEGYPNQWERMVSQHPDVEAGSSNRFQNWEVVDPEKWIPDGYVCVRVDSRGAGRSPGLLDPFSPRETSDLAACIAWAASQPWSSGKVGLNGISYYAMNQWHVASHAPPGLAAICAWEGASDWYRDATHHGGILCTFFGNWYEMQVTTVQNGLGSRGPVSPNTGEPACGPETLGDEELAERRADFAADVAAHPLDDDYHRSRSGDWDRIDVPLLSAGNWGGHGLHLRGNVEGYARSASSQKWLELHGLEHWTHFYTDYGVQLQKRFFGHFLKGEDTGWSRQPPVLLQIRHVDGTFTERAENEWPLARTEWTRWDLGTGSYDALGDGVTFMGVTLERDMEFTGPSAAKLFISSSTADADLFLVLRAFDPDGEEVVFQGAIDPHAPVAQGWLRASHRKLDPRLSTPYRPYHTHDEHQPLAPGEVYELDVEIWPTSLVLPAGYRLALTIRGKDYEYPKARGERLTTFKSELRGSGPFLHDDPDDRPPDVFGGTVTIHPGSYLLLPLVPEA